MRPRTLRVARVVADGRRARTGASEAIEPDRCLNVARADRLPSDRSVAGKDLAMIVSWNWLKDYVRLDMPAEVLADRLMMAGLNLESDLRRRRRYRHRHSK